MYMYAFEQQRSKSAALLTDVSASASEQKSLQAREGQKVRD